MSPAHPSVALLLSLALLGAWCPPAGAVPAPPLRGWLEHVSVDGGRLVLEAKLDTGAKTSSISAPQMKAFQRDGHDWVRFRIEDAGEPRRGHVDLERPVVRWAEVKRHGEASDRRPVIELDICLGHDRRTVETSLTDRSHFNYPVLLGRNFLAGAAVVDAGRKYTVRPQCEEGEDAAPGTSP
jgi:hypothetical protein